MKIVKCRVLKVKKYGKTLYYPQVLSTFMFFFKHWKNIKNHSVLRDDFDDFDDHPNLYNNLEDEGNYILVSIGRNGEDEAYKDIKKYINDIQVSCTIIKEESFIIKNLS